MLNVSLDPVSPCDVLICKVGCWFEIAIDIVAVVVTSAGNTTFAVGDIGGDYTDAGVENAIVSNALLFV